MEEIQVYSAITASYDKYNDSNNRKVFSNYGRFINPRLNAKIYKVLSHRFIDANFSVWVDGNVTLNCMPELLVEMLEDKEILVFKHPDRNCIYKEAIVCKEHRLDSARVIDSQMNRYRKLKWGAEKGLASCRIIVRKHSKNIEFLNNNWWAEITSGSVRDQLSFPVVFDKNIKYIDHPDSYNNEYFTVDHHKELNWIQRKKKRFFSLFNQYD